VSEHGELAAEIVVNADHFFLQVCRSGTRRVEDGPPAVGAGKMPAFKSAVAFRINHARRNGITGEIRRCRGSALDDARRQNAARANLARTAAETFVASGTAMASGAEITTVGGRIRYRFGRW